MIPAPASTTATTTTSTSTTATSTTWSSILDGLAAQLDLQERCIRQGQPAPEPLSLPFPDGALTQQERLRAIAIFERSEELALEAARSLAATPNRLANAYREELQGSPSLPHTHG